MKVDVSAIWHRSVHFRLNTNIPYHGGRRVLLEDLDLLELPAVLVGPLQALLAARRGQKLLLVSPMCVHLWVSMHAWPLKRTSRDVYHPFSPKTHRRGLEGEAHGHGVGRPEDRGGGGGSRGGHALAAAQEGELLVGQ